MDDLLWWHRVGQNVVALGSGAAPCGARVERGHVYTVREVIWPHNSGRVCLRLGGIRPAPCEGFAPDGRTHEPAWAASDFRPARDTSIESLRGLLSPTPEMRRRVVEEMVDEVAHG